MMGVSYERERDRGMLILGNQRREMEVRGLCTD